LIILALRYSYVQAKTRALKSKLLSPDDWRYLLKMRSLENILTFLSGTHYSEPLALHAAGKKPDIRSMSQAFHAELFREYSLLGKSLGRSGSRFLMSLLARYDANNLKAILRGIVRGSPSSEIRLHLYNPGTLSSLPLVELLMVRHVPAVLDVLHGTIFQRPVANALPQFRAARSLFPLEMAIDRAALENMTEAVESLRGRDRQGVRTLAGEFIDYLNLSWLVRLIHIYGRSSEETINYMLSGGLRLALEDLGNLARSSNLVTFTGHLPDEYSQVLEEVEHWPDVERLLKRRFISRLLGPFSRSPFQVGLQVAYLFMKESEIEALVGLASAVHMGMAEEQVSKFVSPPVVEVARV
jgi:V/A-type H+/Na+-transporting ATPase subunit C